MEMVWVLVNQYKWKITLTNSSGNVQGIEGGNLPTPVTYGINLGFKF